MRLGLGLGLGTFYRRPQPPAASPAIDADTSFATDTGWTYTTAGAGASLTIAAGVMSYTSGTGYLGTYYEAATSGIAETDTITLQYEVTAANNANPVFSIGGGAEETGDNSVGTHTVELTCGASGTDLRVRGHPGLVSRSFSIDDLAIV